MKTRVRLSPEPTYKLGKLAGKISCNWWPSSSAGSPASVNEMEQLRKTPVVSFGSPPVFMYMPVYTHVQMYTHAYHITHTKTS